MAISRTRVHASDGKSSHLFKEITLTPAERLWLSEIYRQGFGKIDFASLRVKLWDKLPEGFSAESLHHKKLIYGDHISLLGVWHVDPQSPYVQAADKIIRCLRDILLHGSRTESVSAHEIAVREGIDEEVVEIALMLISDLSKFTSGGGSLASHIGLTTVQLPRSEEGIDKLIHFENIEHELEEFSGLGHRCSSPRARARASERNSARGDWLTDFTSQMGISSPQTPDSLCDRRQVWDAIDREFGVSKRLFAKRIAFAKNKRGRAILFRDVEDAYLLCKNGLPKPAIILAGGVIEELLRLHLETKDIKPATDTFDGYIKACEEEGLLRSSTRRLSDSARHFRNLVHIGKEATEHQPVSKAMARTAVASIFIIVNDFAE